MLLMRSIAQELAPHFIRVNSIAPGAIRTPINTAAWDTPEAYADLMTLVPNKRIGEPDDIAQAAVWLASKLRLRDGGNTVRRWRDDVVSGLRHGRLTRVTDQDSARRPFPTRTDPARASVSPGVTSYPTAAG